MGNSAERSKKPSKVKLMLTMEAVSSNKELQGKEKASLVVTEPSFAFERLSELFSCMVTQKTRKTIWTKRK